jgi:N-acetylmuramoyl-L-alanine amidase
MKKMGLYHLWVCFLIGLFAYPEVGVAKTLQEKQKAIENLPETKLKTAHKKKESVKPKKTLSQKKISYEKKESIKELPKPTPVKKNLPVNFENLPIETPKISLTVKPKKELILIDPGHGANDEGAKMHGCMEKNLCLLTALHLRNLLQAKGYHIVMTRAHDEYVSLDKRVEMANFSKCDLFVSIHYNAAKSKEASGVEIFYPKHQDDRQGISKKLAQNVLQKMIHKTGAKSRGIKAGNFHVIRETSMPAILIEGGFMTHPIEGQHLNSINYIQKISEGIADGIEHFLTSKIR